MTEYFSQLSQPSNHAVSNVNINVNNHVVFNNSNHNNINIQNVNNNNNNNQEYNDNVNSSNDGINNHDNNQSVNNNDDNQVQQNKNNNNNVNNQCINNKNSIVNNNNNNNNNNNSSINNHNTHNEVPNITHNVSLSASADHRVMVCNTKHKKKTVKSQNKLISKHGITSPRNNNMSIKHYFQLTSKNALDNSANDQLPSNSMNENSNLNMDLPLDLNPPPPIVVGQQTDSTLPTQQSQQLQPLPDIVVSRKRPRSPVSPPSSPILANKRRPIGHCSPGTAEGPSGQG